MLNIQKRFTASNATPIIFLMQPSDAPTSIVCSPTSANYSVEFTCTAQEITPLIWVPVADLTAKADLQTKEFGAITGLRMTKNSGTSVIFDIARA